MKITTDHPTSSYGIPVILDDDGNVMDYGPGLSAVRARLGLSRAALGEVIGKSDRTVEKYEQGSRMVPAEALYLLASRLP